MQIQTNVPESAYGSPRMGRYLDQSYRNSDRHNAATIELAIGLGYSPDRETLNLLARVDHDVLSENGRSDSDMLNWCSDEAIDWLNSQETRPFMYWANDGDVEAFGLWCNVEGAREDCGFVSGQEMEGEQSDYPSEDYRGEWLHVSDHGNATLYNRIGLETRGETFRDVEIWSV